MSRPATTAWEQARHLPITYRQFDYWVTTGLLKIDGGGNGHGNFRSISESEMVVLSHAARLVAAGLAPRQAFRVARALMNGPVDLAPGYRIEAA